MNRLNFFGKGKYWPAHQKPEDVELVPRSLFDLNALFESFFNEPFGFDLLKLQKVPAIKVYEEGDKIVVKAEVPGAEKKNIRIFRDGNILTIQGQTRKQDEKKEKNYYYKERFLSQFQRSVRLPEGAKVEGAKANYKDGILTIEFVRDKEAENKGSDIEIE